MGSQRFMDQAPTSIKVNRYHKNVVYAGVLNLNLRSIYSQFSIVTVISLNLRSECQIILSSVASATHTKQRE